MKLRPTLLALLLASAITHAAEIEIGLRDATLNPKSEAVMNTMATAIEKLVQACKAVGQSGSMPPPAKTNVGANGSLIKISAEGGDEATNQRYLQQVVTKFLADRAMERISPHQATGEALQSRLNETSDPKARAKLQTALAQAKAKASQAHDDPDFKIIEPNPGPPAEETSPVTVGSWQPTTSSQAAEQAEVTAFLVQAHDSTLTYLGRPETATKLAKFQRQYYQALKSEGFDAEEAMRIITATGIPLFNSK